MNRRMLWEWLAVGLGIVIMAAAWGLGGGAGLLLAMFVCFSGWLVVAAAVGPQIARPAVSPGSTPTPSESGPPVNGLRPVIVARDPEGLCVPSPAVTGSAEQILAS